MRGQRETRPCAACGEPVTKLLSQAKGERWFCDKECQSKVMPPPASLGKAPNPHRGQQETRPCTRCQKPITRYLRPENVEHLWLCRSCSLVLHPRKPRTGDTIPCDWCGELWYRQPAYIKQNRRYCKDVCWNDAQRVNQVQKVCTYCGDPFRVALSQQERQYCKKRCEADAKIARPLGRMHNGRPARLLNDGYIRIWEPEHPNASRGWVLEHRWVVEQAIGRYLTTEEQIDHIDRDKQHNVLSNLQILSASDHSKKTNAENLGLISVLQDENKTLREELARFRVQAMEEV